jgi:hypothetical protein
MADTAAHLVDRVLPEAPVRQWVLSLPFALRYALAFDAQLTSEVLRIFIRAVFASLRRRARRSRRIVDPQCGAVTFVQRFGDALNLNVHFHTLMLDGVYEADEASGVRFHPLPPPDDNEVARVAERFARALVRLLVRRGFGSDEDSPELNPLEQEQPLLATLYGASVRGRVATGHRGGQRVQRLGDRIETEDIEVSPGERCASVGGISLHANVCVPARDRNRLERLCRYVARPPVASERLSQQPDGRLVYQLRRRWRDGTTHMVFEPLEFMEKLAALVPRPRSHMVRYHGVLAPRSRWRDLVVPEGSEQRPGCGGCTGRRKSSPKDAGEHGISLAKRAAPRQADDVGSGQMSNTHSPEGTRLSRKAGFQDTIHPHSHAGEGVPGPRPRRYSWPELMRRVWEIDVLECPRCHARPMRILAAIHPPETTRAILECLGLPARPPPVAPARPEEDERLLIDLDPSSYPEL